MSDFVFRLPVAIYSGSEYTNVPPVLVCLGECSGASVRLLQDMRNAKVAEFTHQIDVKENVLSGR
jgi:hypothetical protein